MTDAVTQADYSIGDVVEDTEADTDGRPVVVNLPPITAEDWDVYEGDDGTVTVAEDNPGYASDEKVVIVIFDDVLDERMGDWDGKTPINLTEAPGSTYAFPVGRLNITGERYGEEEADEGSDDSDDSGEDSVNRELRERLDAIADIAGELNVDDVTVDTAREAVVVGKLGQQYAIDTDGTVDADDFIARKIQSALDDREVSDI